MRPEENESQCTLESEIDNIHRRLNCLESQMRTVIEMCVAKIEMPQNAKDFFESSTQSAENASIFSDENIALWRDYIETTRKAKRLENIIRNNLSENFSNSFIQNLELEVDTKESDHEKNVNVKNINIVNSFEENAIDNLVSLHNKDFFQKESMLDNTKSTAPSHATSNVEFPVNSFHAGQDSPGKIKCNESADNQITPTAEYITTSLRGRTSIVTSEAIPGAEITDCLAMDFESVQVGLNTMDIIVTRVSIVNFKGICIYDEHAYYMIQVNNIFDQTKKLKKIQTNFISLFENRKLIGHDISFFVNHLSREEKKIADRDTSLYPPFLKLAGNKTPSLNLLAEKVLGINVLPESQQTSIDRAKIVMMLYVKCQHEWEESLVSNEASLESVNVIPEPNLEISNTVAMNCEVIEIPSGSNNIFANQVSIVDFEGSCLYDQLVHYDLAFGQTIYFGERQTTGPKHGRRIKTVRSKVMELIQGKKVIGHQLQLFYEALNIAHEKDLDRDTSTYESFVKLTDEVTPPLIVLAEKVLGMTVKTLTSIEKAKVALKLYASCKNEWETRLSSQLTSPELSENVSKTILTGLTENIANPQLLENKTNIVQPEHSEPTSSGKYIPPFKRQQLLSNTQSSGQVPSITRGPIWFTAPVETRETKQARTLFVRNIPFGCADAEMMDFFNMEMHICGFSLERGNPVTYCRINFEKNYAFLTFRSVDETTRALAFDGINFKGETLDIVRPYRYKLPPGVLEIQKPAVPDEPLVLENKKNIQGISAPLKNKERLITITRPYDHFKDFPIQTPDDVFQHVPKEKIELLEKNIKESLQQNGSEGVEKKISAETLTIRQTKNEKMQKAREEELKLEQICLKTIVLTRLKWFIQRRNGNVLLKTLPDHYKAFTGTKIPLKKLGYSSLENFLLDNSTDVNLKRVNNKTVVEIVDDEATAEITK